MRAFVLTILGLASSACGEVLGGPCSLDDPCEEGVCNLSGPGDPVCIEADGDLDADGLPNKSDFCNTKPGGNLDEDGDGVADDCDDRCPIARPPARPDSDNDGVDAPCDPEPTMDGNSIILFNGFNAELPISWRKEGGSWTAQGGEAIFTSTDATVRAILTIPILVPSRHLAVQTSYRINRVDTGGQNLAGVVSIQRLPLGVTEVSCGGSRIGAEDALIVDTPNGGATMPFTASLFDPGGLYRMAQLIDNATAACAMDANTMDGAVSAGTPGDNPNEAGLLARGIDARFQYILIVQRPN